MKSIIELRFPGELCAPDFQEAVTSLHTEQYEFALEFISAISNIFLLQMCTLEEVYFQVK